MLYLAPNSPLLLGTNAAFLCLLCQFPDGFPAPCSCTSHVVIQLTTRPPWPCPCILLQQGMSWLSSRPLCILLPALHTSHVSTHWWPPWLPPMGRWAPPSEWSCVALTTWSGLAGAKVLWSLWGIGVAWWEYCWCYSLAREVDVLPGLCESYGTSCWGGRSAVGLLSAWLRHLDLLP